MEHLSEYELVKGVLRGKAQCQSALYHRYCGTMYRICLRLAATPHQAEDMLQEGFIRVFRDIQQFQFKGSLEGWIRRVIVRAALRVLRQQQPWQEWTENDEVANWEEDLYPELPDDQTVLEMLRRLPAGYRSVLTLYVIEGYNHEEIADLLGISTGTSKSQLFKARQMLKSLMTKTVPTQ